MGHQVGNTFLLLFHWQKAAPRPIVADKRSPTILCTLATGLTLLHLETEFQSYLPQIPINQSIRFQIQRDFFFKISRLWTVILQLYLKFKQQSSKQVKPQVCREQTTGPRGCPCHGHPATSCRQQIHFASLPSWLRVNSFEAKPNILTQTVLTHTAKCKTSK